VLGHWRKHSPLSASGQVASAIGHGAPILAKDVAIYRDGADAAILHWRKPRELAQAMRDVVLKPNVSSHMRFACKQLATERAWPRVAELHDAFYRQALKGMATLR
jgi:hypothetical protein